LPRRRFSSGKNSFLSFWHDSCSAIHVFLPWLLSAARSDVIGDGKIFVQPLEQCIRIRTGETGQDAIG